MEGISAEEHAYKETSNSHQCQNLPKLHTEIMLPTQSKEVLAILAFRTVHKVKFINTSNDNVLFQFLKIQWCYIDLSNFQAFLQPLFCIGHNLSSPSPGSVFSSAPQALKQSQSLGSQWDNSFANVHGPPSPSFPSHVHLCTGVYIRKMRDNSSQKCFLKTSLFHVPALLFSLLHPFPDTFSLALITRLDTCCQRHFLSTLTVLLNRHCPSNRSLQWKKPKSPAVTQDP